MSTYTDMAPKKLKAEHLEMLLLDFGGASVKEIAEAADYSTDMVYLVRQSPAYQQHLADLRQHVQNECVSHFVEKLNRLTLRAANVYEQALTDPSVPLREKLIAARDLTRLAFSVGMPAKPTTTPAELENLIARLDRALDNLAVQP